jgi:hypothetical protein
MFEEQTRLGVNECREFGKGLLGQMVFKVQRDLEITRQGDRDTPTPPFRKWEQVCQLLTLQES